jgi:hypothetical protein
MTALSSIFDSYNLAAAQNLIAASGKEWEELNNKIDDSACAMEQMAATMNDNLGGDMKSLNSAVESVGISIFEKIEQPLRNGVQAAVGTFRQLANSIKSGPMAKSFESLGNSIGKIVVVLSQVVNEVLPIMVSTVAGVLTALSSIADYVADNWSVLQPIITGVAIAVGLYTAALSTYNVVKGITNTIEKISTLCTNAQAIATGTATEAQWSFNAALLACPLTWIVVAIIAVIVAIYAVVGAINKIQGTTISATGIIIGSFMTVAGVIYNTFWGLADVILGIINYLVNQFINFANFVGNFLTNPVSSIVHLFESMADNVLGILEKIASAMDMIFGSNFSAAVSGWRTNVKNMADSIISEYAPDEDYKEIVKKLDLSIDDFGIERMGYSDLFNSGYAYGANIESGISSVGDDVTSKLASINNAVEKADSVENPLGDSVGGNIGDVGNVGNVKNVSGTVDISNEDLKVMRELATTEFMQNVNQNTIAPNITVEIAEVKETADVSKVISEIESRMQESVAVAAEGVY